MSLVVEDGSIVDGATSYVTAVEARAYADARGLLLPAADADLETLLTLAMDYLEAQRDRYQGSKVSAIQALQFPRVGVVIDGILFPDDVIPSILKQAQSRLAIETHSGVELFPVSGGGGGGGAVTMEKVDVIETHYSEGVQSSAGSPTMTGVDGLLDPLYVQAVMGFLRTVRV